MAFSLIFFHFWRQQILGNERNSERGNQRERDRERAQARTGHKAKNPKGDGLTPEQRRERDAKALQEKAARKAAQAAAGGNNAGGGGVGFWLRGHHLHVVESLESLD
ncbi:hypothetical protein CRG98_014805 [Punica granatum]|uniref:Small EDRK-rich factor-like N-terminal domain-containing protein n=1 Tax=Punica granatum TaxID=22663 RepID=A0A2I0K8F1_PUNGR|nr:hypothetical protein CRG98_014805 [Punica granatum]